MIFPRGIACAVKGCHNMGINDGSLCDYHFRWLKYVGLSADDGRELIRKSNNVTCLYCNDDYTCPAWPDCGGYPEVVS